MNENPIAFACPECHCGLESLENNTFKCSHCNEIYPIIEGIPIFSDMSNYYGEIGKEHMTNLLEDADKFGYKVALKKHCNEPFVYRYTIDETRAKWISIIPHNKHSIFFDVGCGWGTNSVPISKHVKNVIALDATFERVRFVDIRAHQNDITNIIPVLGSAIKLPLLDNSVDIVAFNGVLEWLGIIDKNLNPMDIQLAALREAYRVLKPNGKVYIGIENRYSLHYFLGSPDDHSFIRFTSLMPRKIANMYCKLRKGEPYFTHTHSLKVYQKMLNSCGFTKIDKYLPWPDYRHPDSFCKLEYNELIPFLEEKSAEAIAASWRRRVYMKFLILLTKIDKRGWFCHSYNFVATK